MSLSVTNRVCIVCALFSLAIARSASAAVLVGHWSLNEASGATIGDSSSNALNGMMSGAGVSWATGQLGSCLLFDSSDDHVEIAANPAMDMTGAFSIAFWVRANPALQGQNPTAISAVIDKSHGITGSNGWVVQTHATEPGAISLAVGTGSSFPEPRLPGVIDGTWHHVAFVVTLSPSLRIRGYRDGLRLVDYVDAATTVLNNTGALYFGSRAPGVPARQFEGLLDDVYLLFIFLPERCGKMKSTSLRLLAHWRSIPHISIPIRCS